MKKIIIITTISFLLCSCVSYKQEILNLNLLTSDQYSNLGNNKSIQIKVIDKRMNKDSLGNKRLGNNVITIKSSQSLTDIIQDKINKDLEQNGFLTANSNLEHNQVNKTLTIEIITLNYSAYREFFIGNSKTKILLKIIATDLSQGKQYTTSHNLSVSKKHFIMPLITTDEKTINHILQEALDDIFNNQKLLKFLNN